METVEVYNDELMAGTWIISEGFNRVHSEVLKMCRKYESEMVELQTGKSVSNTFLSRTIPREKGGKGGKPITEYMLNYKQVVFLLSLLTNTKGTTAITSRLIGAADISIAMQLINSFDTDGIDVRYVYAMKDECGRVKIGISNNPERRLSEIQAANGGEVSLIMVKETTLPRYGEEVTLHNRYAKHLIRSEWFSPQVIGELL